VRAQLPALDDLVHQKAGQYEEMVRSDAHIKSLCPRNKIRGQNVLSDLCNNCPKSSSPADVHKLETPDKALASVDTLSTSKTMFPKYLMCHSTRPIALTTAISAEVGHDSDTVCVERARRARRCVTVARAAACFWVTLSARTNPVPLLLLVQIAQMDLPGEDDGQVDWQL